MQQPKYNYVKDKQTLSPNKLLLLIAIPITIGIMLIGANQLYSYVVTNKEASFATPTLNKTIPNTPKGVNFYDETKGFSDDLRNKLVEGKFEELDKIADVLRKGKETFPGGWWKLESFYDSLSSLNQDGNDEFWQINIKTLEKWNEERPNSITAKVALAGLWDWYAWKARGSGYASEISEEQFRLFDERIKKAQEILAQASKLPDKCPGWYAVMLSTAQSSGWNKERYNRLFEEAIKIEPKYPRFYISKAIYLRPQWYGEKGDWEKFAEETYKRFPDKEGAIFYQHIASYMSRYYDNKLFKETNISWEKVKEGFLAREEAYKTNSLLTNQFCRLAMFAEDKETAKELLQKIDDKWDKNVWESYKEFEIAKTKINS
ncbi:MAG: DUF4034 domain-containing protein [Acidobacteria bacterium]|nr:DUF4034 domain-containing protein [Acidobacteriota bacterium]